MTAIQGSRARELAKLIVHFEGRAAELKRRGKAAMAEAFEERAAELRITLRLVMKTELLS